MKMMKLTVQTLSLLAGVVLLAACGGAPQEESLPEENQEVATFNEANVPAEGVDVGKWSGGIQHIGLPTANVQETIDFYLGLGFSLATRHDISGRDFAFMKLGTLLIEVIPTDEPAMKGGAVDHFCLDVKDIESLYDRLKQAGYHMLSDGIQDIAFWQNGARYFFIQGPNNEKIEFCEIL